MIRIINLAGVVGCDNYLVSDKSANITDFVLALPLEVN